MSHDCWEDLLRFDLPGCYLTDESAARLPAEIDSQRACEAFVWRSRR